jgi:predicted site-specific integrase-resolvase
MQTKSKIQQWHSKRSVADRRDVHPRTLERWVAAGRFPPGRKINGRWYWCDTELEQYDRPLVGASAS